MAMAEENLREILKEIAEKQDYKLAKIDITPLSSEGSNYTTILYLATISEQLKPDLHLFAKVANVTEEMRAESDTLMSVYKTEASFYSELALDFERMYNKNNVPVEDRLVTPKYYGHTATTGNETLVLENLEKRQFLNYDRQKPLNWEYASTALTELAKFHALGFALQDERPVEFEKKFVFGSNVGIVDKATVEFLCNGVKQNSDIVDDEYKWRLLPYSSVEKCEELVKAMAANSTTLVFGDFRPSNLMHRRVANGKLEIIILDYQTLKPGSPVFDLFYFIFSSSDEEFRRLYYQQLLDHYFSQLTLALKQLNLDVEKVYPRKTFDDDVNKFQIAGLYMGLALLPLFLVNPADAPEDMANMNGLIVKPNKLAVERINGIVRDFVKWGII